MITRHIKAILLVTGLVTLSAGLAFLVPGTFQAVNRLDVAGDAGLFFLRHWGVEVACIGGLLLYAAFNPAARPPILVAAIIGKAAFVYLAVSQWSNAALAGLRPTAYFDVACVVLYAVYVLQARGARPA